MEIGDKVTRDELKESGWEFQKEILATACEIWTKGTLRMIWRVKYETVYALWDKKDYRPKRKYMLP